MSDARTRICVAIGKIRSAPEERALRRIGDNECEIRRLCPIRYVLFALPARNLSAAGFSGLRMEIPLQSLYFNGFRFYILALRENEIVDNVVWMRKG